MTIGVKLNKMRTIKDYQKDEYKFETFAVKRQKPVVCDTGVVGDKKGY